MWFKSFSGRFSGSPMLNATHNIQKTLLFNQSFSGSLSGSPMLKATQYSGNISV